MSLAAFSAGVAAWIEINKLEQRGPRLVGPISRNKFESAIVCSTELMQPCHEVQGGVFFETWAICVGLGVCNGAARFGRRFSASTNELEGSIILRSLNINN